MGKFSPTTQNGNCEEIGNPVVVGVTGLMLTVQTLPGKLPRFLQKKALPHWCRRSRLEIGYNLPRQFAHF
jgi:hypothetical protein